MALRRPSPYNRGMVRKIRIALTLCTFALPFQFSPHALAQEAARSDRPDLTFVSRVKREAFERSQVMDTLSYLTDVYGPRLTASPEFKQAADWAVERLKSYGAENARLEKWGTFGRSWALKQYSIEMLEPRYAVLDAAALAWSDVTRGSVTGEVIYAPYGGPVQSLDPQKQQQDLDRFMAEWKGKLKGKIVLLTRPRPLVPSTQPTFSRYTDKELSDIAAAPEPVARLSEVLKLEIPNDPEEERALFRKLPAGVLEQLGEDRRRIGDRRAKFLKDEGVLAALYTSPGSFDGLIFAQAAGPWKAKDTLAPPTFIVTREQYNRMVRLTEKSVPVKMRVNLAADVSPNDVDAYNVTAELPGGAKKDEVVMIGAHLDSWHSGTGATDNAAGSAVMIEVMRILKSLNVRLDRTVRIALWSGEEEGIFGSEGYVKQHFGDPETMKLTAEQAKLSGYFNFDNGTGKIRGVYLQGNDAMRPIFEQWFAPFRDEGVATISIRNTGGTDHLSFDAVGLPGFQFIQDPMDYSNVTHHSQVDTLDHVHAEDLMQASAVIATIVAEAANRPDLLPRKPLPAPAVKLPVAAAAR
jgi:carboxypeptidase Q